MTVAYEASTPSASAEGITEQDNHHVDHELMEKVFGIFEKNLVESSTDSSTDSDSDQRGSWKNVRKATVFRRKIGRGRKMVDQGLHEYDDQDDLIDQDDQRFATDFEDRKLEQGSVVFDGNTFYRNKRYIVGDRFFAIIHFLQNEDFECNSAYCTELIKFNETVLEHVQDTSDIKHLAPLNISEFVQRAGQREEISLSDLEAAEDDAVQKIPDWMYIERERGSSCRFFGLVNVSKRPERNGFRKAEPKGIDFFAGAGLASRGFEASGFKIVASIEKNEEAVQSYAKLHNAKASDVSSDGWKSTLEKENGRVAFHGTAKDFLAKFKECVSLRKALCSIDIVILCPPCQGFSKANVFKEGQVEENNNESLRILDAAELIRPKILVFENVLGLWEMDHIKGYFQKIVYGLMNKGYNVQVGKLCAADFGDPQTRPRLILIASLSQIGLPVFPRRTHGRPFMEGDVSGTLIPFVAAQDVLKAEEGKHAENETPIRRDVEPRPSEPAKTVMASKSAPHYGENRLYSLSENAILMGQDGNEFVKELVGDKRAKQRQIGNGVPMELVKAIGRSVREVLKWNWVGVDDTSGKSGNRKSQRVEVVEPEVVDMTCESDDDEHGIKNESNVGIKNESNASNYKDDPDVMMKHEEGSELVDMTCEFRCDEPGIKNDANVMKNPDGMKHEEVPDDCSWLKF